VTVRTAVGTEDEVSTRVLIVARDGTDLDPIRGFLHDTTIHIVQVAERGAEAISFMESNAVDVVALVDLPSPESVGIAQKIRERWPGLGVATRAREDRGRILEGLRAHFRYSPPDMFPIEDGYLEDVADDMYEGELSSAILRAAGRPW